MLYLARIMGRTRYGTKVKDLFVSFNPQDWFGWETIKDSSYTEAGYEYSIKIIRQ